MSEVGGGETPQGELSSQSHARHETHEHGKLLKFPGERRQVAIGKELLAPLVGDYPVGKEWSHENLVHAFRARISEQQATHEMLYESAAHYRALPPEVAVRNVLDWYVGSGNTTQAEAFRTLRYAWDALAYERYEVSSQEEHLAGASLSAYYNHHRALSPEHPVTAITLTDPLHVRVLDALAEAVGIPHQKGQTAIEIPDKCQQYLTYQMSPEYHERWAQAKAKRNT